MHRGVMVGIVLCVLLASVVQSARAAGESGSVRVEMPAELAGKEVTLHAAEESVAGEVKVSEDPAEDWHRILSEDGTAMFTGLPEGMYLLTLENSLSVVIVLPEKDGSWMARVGPGMEYIPPETGQPVGPVLWAMGMILSAFGIGAWYESWHKRRKK